MSTDAIFAKYAHALEATNIRLGGFDQDAVRLALHLAIADAYAAGSALAEDLAAIVASQATMQQAESIHDCEYVDRQMRMIADWLIANSDGQKTARTPGERILDAIKQRDGEIDALRQQLAQLDADNADLTQRLSNLAGVQAEAGRLRQEIADLREQVIPDYQNNLASLSAEIDRLTQQNVIAVETFNSLSEAHSNGNGAGVDPMAPTLAAWGRACPAWDGMTDEERIALYELTSGRAKFGELSLELRTEILARVLRHTMDGAERLTMARFDNRKPEWMPMASGLVKVFGGKWPKLLDLATAPA